MESDRQDWMAGMTDFQRAEVARLESRIVSFEKRWQSLEADWNDCKKALAAAIKQRDEAQELHCRQIAYDLFRTTGVFDPQQVAIKRGWAGLFRVNEPAPREKEGGGA